jgi:hypothetical protein
MQHKVMFTYAGFVFPQHCAVCDGEDAALVQYTQGHFPVPIPFFGGIYTQTPAELPYCKYHAEAFRHRFFVLKATQYAVIAVALPCLYAGLFLNDHGEAQNRWLAGVLVAVAVVGLAVILPLSLVARRLMYDAFFRVYQSHMVISSKHPQFIARLREVNEGREVEIA